MTQQGFFPGSALAFGEVAGSSDLPAHDTTLQNVVDGRLLQVSRFHMRQTDCSRMPKPMTQALPEPEMA